MRRIRNWWRHTPRGEIAQTALVLGVVLIVAAALIILGPLHR